MNYIGAYSETYIAYTGGGALAPTIASFTPTSGAVSSNFTITGTNLTGATAVTVNNVAVASFTVVNATTISVSNTASVTTGLVRVTTPGGTATSGSSFTVTLPGSPPTIASFTPAVAGVGATVTVTGTVFTGATAVKINGLAAAYVVVNSTTITLTVPAGVTAGPISVTTPAGTATSGTSFTPAVAYRATFSGQSNSQGVGYVAEVAGALAALTPSILREFQRVFMWNPTSGQYEKLQAGVNNLGAYSNSFGPEIGFAQFFEETFPTAILYIDKYARGGQYISYWKKGGPAVGYAELTANMAAADAATPSVFTRLAFDWKQGEADAGSVTYQADLQEFRDNLVADGRISNTTPFLVNQCRYNDVVSAAEQAFVTANSSYARFIKTKNYGTQADNLHYDAVAQFLNGYTDMPNALNGTTNVYPIEMGTPGPPCTTLLDDTSGQITYSTVPILWTAKAGDVPSHNNTNHNIFGVDCWAGFNFTGMNVEGYFAGYVGQPIKYDIFVDGAYIKTYDVPAGAAPLGYRWGVGNLANASHYVQITGRQVYGKLTIVDLLATSGVFDAAYTGPATLPLLPSTAPNPIEESDAKVYKSAGWAIGNNAQDSASACRYMASGSTGLVGVSFTGTEIAHDHGGYALTQKYDVYLDGVFQFTHVSSGASALQQRWAIAGLAPGLHHLQIVARAAYSAFGWADRFRTDGSFSTYGGSTTIPV